jgi:hypothetical protein
VARWLCPVVLDRNLSGSGDAHGCVEFFPCVMVCGDITLCSGVIKDTSRVIALSFQYVQALSKWTLDVIENIGVLYIRVYLEVEFLVLMSMNTCSSCLKDSTTNTPPKKTLSNT